MGSTITLKAADGFSLSAYSAGSASAKAGLVVVQAIFGGNHHMRDMTDRFAAAGYLAISPALFDRVERGVELGYTPDDIAKGCDYRMKLNDAQVIQDIEAAAAHLGAKKSESSAPASAAPSPGGVPPAPPSSPHPPAGTAAASPAPRTSARTARCRCISARRTPRSR